ncbi:hypothetical protein OCU04_003704 [Sclerotinia nivalis]|uniref:F-box domain-containing protein n=1 Tax=Sclerotinia nivalis TaxID=352851 RepID=A0A9X0DPK0_9HELO|nr:hypothetical protein OCU04_003704 [Sclerotinia nivalis]
MNLTPASLSALTQRSVHLNDTSCTMPNKYGAGASCCVAPHKNKYSTKYCYQEHDEPLGTSSENEAIVVEWQRAGRYIASCIKPSVLKLYFTCDVENLEVGQRVVDPFRSMPTLADCSIGLSQGHHALLRSLAVETAIRAKRWRTAPQDDEPTFRFMDLPQELRLQVLKYTDLVTPLKEVEWNPRDNFYLHYRSTRCLKICGEYDMCGDQKQHYGCQFRDCWETERDFGCFCPRYHASYSSRCHCWRQPTPLFLVCRALYEDARAVFFSMNHFVITPMTGCTEPAETPDHLETLIFLKDALPPASLQYLKSLEIVFPPFRDDYLMPHEPAYDQWLQAIDYMCQLNLPILSLAVSMAGPLDERWVSGEHFRAMMSAEQAHAIIQVYFRIIQPLSKLRQNGLQAFFLTLASPLANSTGMCTRHGQELLHCKGFEKSIIRKAKQAEQMVMGEDYDSAMVQDRAHGESQWLREKEFIEGSC